MLFSSRSLIIPNVNLCQAYIYIYIYCSVYLVYPLPNTKAFTCDVEMISREQMRALQFLFRAKGTFTFHIVMAEYHFNAIRYCLGGIARQRTVNLPLMIQRILDNVADMGHVVISTRRHEINKKWNLQSLQPSMYNTKQANII